MNAVSVRRIGPDDWRAWRDVRLAALADAPYAFPGELPAAQQRDEAGWREQLDTESGVWLLASVGDELVGQAGAWLPLGPPPTLVSLWVRPTHRGKGVGDALVAEILAWAREERYTEVQLWVLETNEPAQRLYRRHGFVSQPRYMPYPDAPGMREQLMVCPL